MHNYEDGIVIYRKSRKILPLKKYAVKRITNDLLRLE